MSHPLVIIFITYAARPERTGYALRSIDSVFKNLITPRGFSWYICDDGSPGEHHNIVRERIKHHGGHICGHHNQRIGYGAGVNKAWPIASQTGPVTLWLEDDWELEEPWDLTTYINLLNGDNSVGMVRLGHLPYGLKMESIPLASDVYLDIDISSSMAYSGNPHLKHDRFLLHYGPFATGKTPGDTEIAYDTSMKKKKSGPRIVWPIYVGNRYLWGHIGTVPSYYGATT